MDILLSVNEKDLECKIFDTSLLEYTLNRFRKNKYNVKIFTRDESVKKKYKDFLIKGSNLFEVVNKSTQKSNIILITRLSLNNINFDNLIKYHDNYTKEITVVCKNLVKNKSIPIYKLDDSRNVTEVVHKRYADCGIYLLSKGIKLEDVKSISALLNIKMKNKQVKSFIHSGYWYSIRNIRRRHKDETTFNFKK